MLYQAEESRNNTNLFGRLASLIREKIFPYIKSSNQHSFVSKAHQPSHLRGFPTLCNITFLIVLRNMRNHSGNDIKDMTRRILPWVPWRTAKGILLEGNLMCWQHRHKTISYIFVIVSKRGLELITLCDFEIMGAQTISHIILPPVWISQVDDLAGWLQDLYSVCILHALSCCVSLNPDPAWQCKSTYALQLSRGRWRKRCTSAHRLSIVPWKTSKINFGLLIK